MIWTREAILQQFSLKLPGEYTQESRQRVTHLDSNSLRNAAVLIGFVQRQNEIGVIFTQRAKHLRHHPGQVSFPGGKQEITDTSIYATALRETEEEIGIEHQKIEVIGQLPSLMTITGFSVTPVVAFISEDYQLAIDANEVADVFEVPLNFLLSRHNLITQRFSIKQRPHNVLAIPFGQRLIWGATAQIIHLLQQQLR
jgi:8-oxo-dGTP pyrophosphatase MutT (NUDIX family)